MARPTIDQKGEREARRQLVDQALAGDPEALGTMRRRYGLRYWVHEHKIILDYVHKAPTYTTAAENAGWDL